jgi:hypothetical protein
MINAIRIGALVAVLLTPRLAQAQQSLGGWRGLNPSSLDTVYVTDDAGRTTEGKLLKLDTDSLVMLVNGAEQRFGATQILRIEKRGDSLKNGALIGATIGVIMGSLMAGISDCPDSECGAGYHVTLFAVGTGIYTAIGTAIDAMIVGRTRVFEADRSTTAARSLSGPRLAVRLRW